MNDLTGKQTDRLDFVHNTIHEMLCALAGREIEEDVSVIAEISDLAEEYICNKLGLMTDQEFAPYVEDSAVSKQEPLEDKNTTMLSRYLMTRKVIAKRGDRIVAISHLLSLLKHCGDDTIPVSPSALASCADMIDSELCGILEGLDDFIFPTEKP